MTKHIDLFLKIISAGLWEDIPGRLSADAEGISDEQWQTICSLAEEQTVEGLFAAGIDCLGLRPPKPVALKLLKRELSLEKANASINTFIAKLFGRFDEEDISAMLVKGQGIGKNYVRPAWRTPGDVDLLLSAGDYEKAKAFLIPKASLVDEEYKYHRHFGMFFGKHEVELHGTMYSLLSFRIDRNLSRYQDEMLSSGRKSVWDNSGCAVPVPDIDTDTVFIFTHILQHFFKEGIGLRQICDWCRLLWTGRESIDTAMLGQRLREMGIMDEWKAFACFAVKFLAMPEEAMPFHESASKWERKARRILSYVFATGNFGTARDMSYKGGRYVSRKIVGLFKRVFDYLRYHLLTFPMSAPRFLFHSILISFNNVLHGQ